MQIRAFMKQEDEKKKNAGAGAAKQAQESASIAEVAEFAGNASAFDPSDPLSPLVTDIERSNRCRKLAQKLAAHLKAAGRRR